MQTSLNASYQTAMDRFIKTSTQTSYDAQKYLQRTGPENKYRNTYVKFTSGEIAYVTRMGVVKRLHQDPPNNAPLLNLSIPWKSEYSVPGTEIPTSPTMVSGTDVIPGQSLGLEGTNVFVNRFFQKSDELQFEGCYRQVPVVTETKCIPIMPASNQWNGYISSASSVFNDNNAYAGPWAAFDQSSSTFWHSSISSGHTYDAITGDYKGSTLTTPCRTETGVMTQISGEYIDISTPSVAPGIKISKYEIQGRQGCCGTSTVSGRSPNSWVIVAWVDGEWSVMDTQTDQNLNYSKGVYQIQNAPAATRFRLVVTNCGSPDDRTKNRYCVQISEWNLYSYQTSSSETKDAVAMNVIGKGITSIYQCRDLATYTGNAHFSLSDNGECRASNDLAQAQQFGPGTVSNPIPLWDSWASGGGRGGTQASLTTLGSLQVFNASLQPIYLTPLPDSLKQQLAPFIGCYSMSQTAFSLLGSEYEYSPNECIEKATSVAEKYVGFSGNIVDDKVKQCVTASTAPTFVSNACVAPAGGIDSVAVYSTSASGSCFLILQDDGNMCIYLGSGPDDNQGVIWASNTAGKQRDPDPARTASKGKTGRNTLLPGEVLLPNEFIGSTHGDIYLIMQSDGNLVLYTSSVSSGCTQRNNGPVLGSASDNAIYRLSGNIYSSVMGMLGMVDENSTLRPFSKKQTRFSNSYQTWRGIDAPENDIQDGAMTVTGVDECKRACSDRTECGGFVTNADGTACWLKSEGTFPYGSAPVINSERITYSRNREPDGVPPGWTRSTTFIDSQTYNSFDKGEEADLSSPIGLAAIYAYPASGDNDIDIVAPQIADSATSSMKQWSTMQRSREKTLSKSRATEPYLHKIRRAYMDVEDAIHGSLLAGVNEGEQTVQRRQYWFILWFIGTLFVLWFAWIMIRIVSNT